MTDPLPIAKNRDTELCLLPALANRHGLITGATGTGKTVTLQVMAERFSKIGVPVFMADVKGDLSGITQPGAASPKLAERLKLIGADEPAYSACPAVFWDVFGEQGHPIRATVSDLGPLLLSRVLNLNETQAGVLALVFKVADDNGLLLLDLKDLRAMLQHVADHAQELQTNYGNVSAASVGAIQRGLLALEQQGAERFIGEPMLNVDDLLQTGDGGRGVVNILVADKLMNAPIAVFDAAAVAPVRALRAPARGGRPRQAEARVLLRRGAPPVHGCAEDPAGQDRAGRPPDPIEGCRRLFRHAESARRARDGAGPARQPRPACAARVHAARPEGGQGRGRNDARQSQDRHGEGDHRARRRRSARYRSSTRKDGRSRSTARTSCRPAAGSAPPRRRNGSASSRRPGSAVCTTRQSTASPRTSGSRGESQSAPPAAGSAPAAGGSWTDSVKDSLGGLLSGSGRKDSIVEAVAKSAARTIGSTVGREIVRGVLGSLLGGRRR